MDRLKLSWIILIVAVTQFILLLAIAEFLYPGYSVSNNTISSLGSMVCPKNSQCFFEEPSATIFNTSVTFLGVLILIGSLLLISVKRFLLISITLIITGIGAIGVGLTLAFHSPPFLHSLVSFITFLFSSISSILSFRVLPSPLAYLSLILGIISLASIFLFASGNYLGLGIGGMERMIVYPTLIWGLVFSSSLINFKGT